MTSPDRFPKICRHCGLEPLTLDAKGRWIKMQRWGEPSRFCLVGGGHPKLEHAPVPLWNPKKLDAWLDSEPLPLRPF